MLVVLWLTSVCLSVQTRSVWCCLICLANLVEWMEGFMFVYVLKGKLWAERHTEPITYTLLLSLSDAHSCSHMCVHTHKHSFCHSLTHAHTHTYTLSLSHPPTTHLYAHTHTYNQHMSKALQKHLVWFYHCGLVIAWGFMCVCVCAWMFACVRERVHLSVKTSIKDTRQ